MSKLSWLSVMLLGCCLAIGCGEGDTGGDTATSSPESMTNETMEAGSGVGGGVETDVE
jgi:hypothetical protein